MTEPMFTYESTPAMPWAPDDVLTIDQLAERLQVSVRTVERMDLPTIYCGRGHKLRRYLWGQIVDALKERAA
jgi:hypothetical protein